MNEHSFIRSIHKALHPDVYKWKIHDTYTGGVPDAMYAGPAGVLFVEYKYIKSLPKRDDTVLKHSLSALQLAWLENMSKCTNVALIIGVENSAIILASDFSKLICKHQYVEQSITKNQIAQWIYSITHDEKTVTDSSSKFSKNLGPEKN